MKCEVCKKSPPEGPSIYRMSKFGETPARWRCKGCMTPEQLQALDPEVKTLVEAIESRNHEPTR